jgi:hypothetical protein
MHAKFRLHADEALEALVAIIRDPNGNTQHKVTAAKDILDRAGYRAAHKVEKSVEVTHYDATESLLTKLETAFAKIDEQTRPRTVVIDVNESGDGDCIEQLGVEGT